MTPLRRDMYIGLQNESLRARGSSTLSSALSTFAYKKPELLHTNVPGIEDACQLCSCDAPHKFLSGKVKLPAVTACDGAVSATETWH